MALPPLGRLSGSELLANAREVRRRTGKSVAAQFLDMARLRLGPQCIQTDEYYGLRLFDPNMSPDRRAEYMGRWAFERIYRIQDPDEVALGNDKLRTYAHFRTHDLPFPAVLGVYHPDETFDGAVSLRSAAEVYEWLTSTAPYPLFMKPSRGDCGWQARLLTAREGEDVRLGDGTLVPIVGLLSGYDFNKVGPLIFQERIVPHPDLAAMIGDRTATARVTVLNNREDPLIWRASLRMPVGGNMIDTFGAGGVGNLLARLNRETGEMEEVIAELGVNRRTTEVHPDTGKQLRGNLVPDWPEAAALVIRAARTLPGLKINGWDVAFSDRGPLLVEFNPKCALPQHANDRGVAEPRFLEMYPDGKI
ncbi:MAG: sugar-transfer associated ATP-grasp domain-containing protein [Pacificimonas sp.]